MHQFDKVEMFSFVRPEDSEAEHERLLAIQERILQALEIPYRVVDIAVGDLGASGGAQVRLRGLDPQPVPLPRGHLVLEHDRLPGAPPRLPLPARARRPAGHVHTLNGTAVAVGRTLIALIENGQRADGSVELPRRFATPALPAAIGGG